MQRRAGLRRAVGGALAAVAVLGAWAIGHQVRRHAGRGDAGAAAPRTPPTRLGGAPGTSWRYDVRLTVDATVGGAPLLATRLDAALEVAALSADAHGARLRARLVEPKLALDGNDPAAGATVPLAPIERQLAEPFEYAVSADGDLQRIWLPGGTEPYVSRMLRALMAYTQVVTPAGADRAGWDAIESDATGRFSVHYAAGSKPDTLSKRKLAALRVSGVPGTVSLRARAVTFESGAGEVNTDGHEIILGLSFEERMRLDAAGLLGGDVTTVTRIAVTGGRPLAAPSAFVAAATGVGAGAGLAIDQEAPRTGHEYWTDLGRIAGHTVPDIVGSLRRLSARHRGSKEARATEAERTRLFVAASALLRRDPKAVAQALDVIRGGGPQADFFVHALGSAGSKEAAAALTGLLRDPPGAKQTRVVLAALGNASQPSLETVEAMAATFHDPQTGGYARLMAGALAYHSQETAPAVSSAATDQLLTTLAGETDRRYQADTLRALGNSGADRAVDAARPYAGGDDPLLRAAAAQAVRRVPGAAADELLGGLMVDAVPAVRSSALDAALGRDPDPTLVSRVEAAARLDPDANVRREAVRALVGWRSAVASAREALAWIAANDGSDNLRAIAAEGLARFN